MKVTPFRPTQWSQLPDELIKLIGIYLPKVDAYTMLQVCQFWNYSLIPLIWKSIDENALINSNFTPDEILEKYGSFIQQLHLQSEIFLQSSLTCLKNFSPNLRHLNDFKSLIQSDISRDLFKAYFSKIDVLSLVEHNKSQHLNEDWLIYLFNHVKIQTLNLDLQIPKNIVFDSIPQLNNLQKIIIFQCSFDSWIVVTNALPKLQHLSYIDITRGTLFAFDLQVLVNFLRQSSSLPRLKSLLLNHINLIGSRNNRNPVNTMLPFKYDSIDLKRCRTLHLGLHLDLSHYTGSYYPEFKTDKIIQLLNFRTLFSESYSNLTELCLSHISSDIFILIIKHCRNLIQLCLESHLDFVETELSFKYLRRLCIQSLDPRFDGHHKLIKSLFPKLTLVQFESPCSPIYETGINVKLIIQLFPHIRNLIFGQNCIRHVPPEVLNESIDTQWEQIAILDEYQYFSQKFTDFLDKCMSLKRLIFGARFNWSTKQIKKLKNYQQNRGNFKIYMSYMYFAQVPKFHLGDLRSLNPDNFEESYNGEGYYN